MSRDIAEKSKLDVIWFFVRPYKLQVGLLLALSLVSGIFEAATIAAIYPILNAAFSSGADNGGFLLSAFQTVTEWLPVSDLFIGYCITFAGLASLAFILKFLAIRVKLRLIAAVVAANQNLIYRQLMRADYQYFVEHKQGELQYNAINAPYQLSTLVSSITDLISQSLMSISVFIVLISLSWVGALGSMGFGLLYILLSRYLSKKVSYQAAQNEQRTARKLIVQFNESTNGIKQIKVFGIVENWIRDYGVTVRQRWQYFVSRSFWQQIMPVILMMVLYLAVATVVLVIKITNPDGYLEMIPVFGAFAFAVFRLVPFVGSVGGTIMGIQTSLPDCEVMHNVMDQNLSDIRDGETEMDSFKESIEFKDVSFAYKGRSETLNRFSAVFEKGKTTAIVGRSGSGKTTVVSLILRLYDAESGEIRIDGVPIQNYRLESWLKNIGYVSQDTFILNDTIEANILFGAAGYSHEAVIEAAKYADAHVFINNLPEGYNTTLGDRGMKLSGGQAQRISVARAMLQSPEILIFDEATNNLDNISEQAVQRAIEEISRDHTVILVAHRLSTIEKADKILVLDKGELKEQGTHEELLALKGYYWNLQQGQM